MKDFLRNIRGSKLWRQTLAIFMVVAVIATLVPMDIKIARSEENKDLLDASTTVKPTAVDLTAQYKDENGNDTTVKMNQEDTFNIPYDSDIVMKLQFMLADGNAVNGQTTYTYTLPSTVRVDVNDWHELTYQAGESIGKVYIKDDGTMDFQFYEDVVANKTNIPFFVQFEGSFSSGINQANQQVEVEFPASNGNFTFHIETLPASKPEVVDTPKDIGIAKSGNVITGADGKRYIEWNINLKPNGRDSIDGDIVDALPAGLTYAAVDGYPKISQNQWGDYGNVAASVSGDTVTLSLTGTGSNDINVLFCTSYDNSAFGGSIDNKNYTINNTAVFNPDDTTDQSVSDDGSVWINPNLVSKSSGSNKVQLDEATGKYYIDWTVVLNTEQLDIGGATYTDTIGSGLIMPEASGIQITGGSGLVPAIDVANNKFTIAFPNQFSDKVTLMYRTYVNDANIQQSEYTNTAKLTGGNVSGDFTQTGRVTGVNFLDKSIGNADYDKITKTFRWTITVNQDKAALDNVVVTDTFNSTEMEFVSTNGTLASSSNEANGSLVFELGNISDTVTIQVVTRIKAGFNQPYQWYDYKNNVTMTATDCPTFTDSASYSVNKDWTVPEFLSKDGTMNGDGTITWNVTVEHVSSGTLSMDFLDILPENMEYVDGSFTLKARYWEGDFAARTPQITTDDRGIQTLTYDLEPDTDSTYINNTEGFVIRYKTKITKADAATTSGNYTNNAKMRLNFENNIYVDDDATKTVTGIPGGVLDKTYTYNNGREVIWNIKINEARLNLNVTDPIIEDQLADYLDYVSGTLYLVNEDGTRSSVASNDYYITTINKKLVVQLPDITNQCYEFEFVTRFNTTFASELENETVNNTVTFKGSGKTYVDTTNTIQNIQFSSSSAGAVLNQEIRIKKVDAGNGTTPLAGAVFQLKLNNVVVGEATSGNDGYAVFKNMDSSNYGYSFDLVEITAPSGYKKAVNLDPVVFAENKLQTDSNGVRYIEVVVENENVNRQTTGSVTVKKVDGATNVPLSGAVFGIYSDSACLEDDLLITMTATGTDGLATYAGLTPGTYYIKEMTSPEGYIPDTTTVIKAVLTQETNTVTTKYYDNATDTEIIDVEIANTKIAGALEITKTSATDSSPLSGAVFGLYNDALCTDLVRSETTGVNGKATFTNLVVGKTYYYREDTAPTGYVQDSTIYSVKIGTGTERQDVTIQKTITNQPEIGTIVVTKYGDDGRLLPGVTFTLYESNGATLYDKDSATSGIQSYEVTTDENGVAKFENLPFGSYVVKETSGLENYIVSGDTSVTVNKLGNTDVTVVNQAKKATIRVVKSDSVNNTVLLPGAVFGLYTMNNLRVATATTDANGVAEFRNIGYGDYYIQEITPPVGYIASDTKYNIVKNDFNTAITANASNPVITQNIQNEKQDGKILLKKVDGNANGLAGATFTLYDELGVPVATTTSMTAIEATNAVAAGVTNAELGSIYFEHLTYGTYYIQETQAPDTYIRDTGYYKIVIDSQSTVTQYYGTGGNLTSAAIVNVQMNPPYVSFKLKKTDEDGHALAGATFGFYQDGVTTPIATAVSGADGMVYFRRINIESYPDNAKYTVKEISAPAGYTIDANAVIEFTDKEALRGFEDGDASGNNTLSLDSIKWINSTQTGSTYENTGIKGSILLTKYGVTNLEPLAGAEFTLYDTAGQVVFIDGNPAVAVTGSDGKLRFENVPYGSYIIKETKAPAGYTVYQSPISVNVTSSAEVVLPAIRDTRIQVRISKQAVGGAAELAGAELELKKLGGTLIDTWTSGTSAHQVTYSLLEVGQTYVLSEKKAPNGYAYTSDVTFKIEENGAITLISGGEVNGQTIIMRDQPFTLSVSKQIDVTTTELANAILALYDETGTEIEKWTSGTVSHAVDCSRIVAPKTGYNEYTLKELSAPNGYEIADSIVIAINSSGQFFKVTTDPNGVKQYDGITGATVIMKDKIKPSGTFYIRKLDMGTGLPLSGAKFEIRNAGSTGLVDVSGNPLTGDMWSWTSTDTPHAIDASLLVADNSNAIYELVEIQAPDGYTIANPIQFRIVTESTNLKIQYVSGDAGAINTTRDTFTVEDIKLSLTIRKQNEFGVCVSGATLKLSEYDIATDTIGNEVETFETTTAEKTIDASKLKVNQSYILQETVVPEGYNKADDIVFTIRDDATIERKDSATGNSILVVNNKIIMEDISSGIVINKMNEDMEFVSGAKLQITSPDDILFTTKEWTTTEESKVWDMLHFRTGYTYRLTEVDAPNGYAYAAPIEFQISNEGTKIYVNGELQDNRVITMTDDKLKLTISKQDITNGEELPDAKLEIRDDAGTLIYSFTSGTTPTMIPMNAFTAPEPGNYQTYTLTEITAPNGYAVAETITFAFDSTGTVYIVTRDENGNDVYTEVTNHTVVMQDAPKYSISKQDIAGNEVPGATITITTTEDDTFQPITFVSGTEPTYFENGTFKPNVTYTLTETNAPNGYAYAESIQFKINDNGKVYVNGKAIDSKQIVMVDDVITVSISKQDITNSKELAGAKLVIKNEAGEVIHSFTSTNTPTLIPSEVFTAPKPGNLQYYSLTEITAPKGYEVAETIYFAIDSTGAIYIRDEEGVYKLLNESKIVMQDQPAPEETATEETSTEDTSTITNSSQMAKVPKTGDTMQLNLVILIGLISLFTGCILLERNISKK